MSINNLYTQPGTYTITLFASKGICIDTAARVLRVDIPSLMEVPNVFTPNGDNANDLFFLKASNLEEISVNIFDRWGNVVFYSVSATGNIEWDGKTRSGKDAAEGTYFYVIKASGKDGVPYEKKGTLSLYR